MSFYTTGQCYERLAADLADSCDQYGLRHKITCLDPIGNTRNLVTWQKNEKRKPQFIRDALVSAAEPILWVDADAVFVQDPKQFEYRGPIACPYVYFWQPGVVYAEPSPAALRFLDAWIEETKRNWQHLHSGYAFIQVAKELHVEQLPPSYYCRWDAKEPERQITGEAVVEQRQASRFMKGGNRLHPRVSG